jgi:peptidoglycan/xylan/chitin deacetylase (PgdA/CDA1 family)
MLHQFQNPESGRPGHDPQMVSDCLKRLKKQGYAFLDLDEALSEFNQPIVKRHKAAVFTLDDGFLHQVQTAHDVFSAHQCPFTCFLITDFMDGKSWPWDAQVSYLLENSSKDRIVFATESGTLGLPLSTSAERRLAGHEIRQVMKARSARHKSETKAFLTDLAAITGVELPATPPAPYLPVGWDLARELEGNGARFGAHGLTHHILSQLGAEEVKEEIVLSRERVCSELVRASEVFCYPVGRDSDFSAREKQLVAASGFKAAVSAIPGCVTSATAVASRFCLPRFTFPECPSDFFQYSSWIEHLKSHFR